LKKNSKIIAVFSAPLTIHDGKKRSLPDVVLEQGRNAENGIAPSLDIVKSTYQKILEMVNSENKAGCENTINFHLEKTQKALDEALEIKEFVNEIRSRALAFSGEILMSHVMNYVLRSNGIKTDAVDFENWPIVTDNNIEFTNFLAPESREKMGGTADLVEKNEGVTIG
jgi:aspartate kinase